MAHVVFSLLKAVVGSGRIFNYISEMESNLNTFYENSTILISGGTGFLGKVLIEKLLRCFEVKRIYLLMRSKDDDNIQRRLQNLLQDEIFDYLRGKTPDVFSKLTPIETDFTVADLSISQFHLDEIHEDVEIVFNIVASVKFNEELEDAIQINFLGTKRMLDLVLGIKKIKSFIHVSTLYSNCNRQKIDEQIYEHTLQYDQLIPLAKVTKQINATAVETMIFHELPNTYTLTKHFAEKLIYDKAYHLPTGIFRPPIVISNYKDYPGWTDNLNGPSGIVAWTVRGYIHCIYGNESNRANLVPVDYCINALIATAWDVSDNFQSRIKKCSNIPIYNYIYKENNLTWGKYMNLVPLGFHEPLNKSIWYYSYFITSSKVLFNVLNFLLHSVPGFIMDMMAFCSGKKMIYSKAYKKTENVLLMMSYFGKRQWEFENTNIQRLASKTKEMKINHGTLEFDMKTINWEEYFHHYIPGIKKYYFKEDSAQVHKLKKSYRWKKRAHLFLKYVIYIILSQRTLKAFMILMSKLISKMIIN